MSELINKRLEESIADLNDLYRRKLFTRREIKAIVKKRRSHEVMMTSGGYSLSDVRGVIDYEKKLEETRQWRRDRLPIKKKEDSDRHFTRRLKALYRRGAAHLQSEDEKLAFRNEHVKYLTEIGAKEEAGQILRRSIDEAPTKDGVWVDAARWELRENKSVDNARAVLQRGLRMLTGSKLLWRAYFLIELTYWGELLSILKTEAEKNEAEGKAPDEIPAKLGAVLLGKIPEVVHSHATKSAPKEAVRLTIDFLEQCTRFPFTARLQRALGRWLEARAEEGDPLALAASLLVPVRIAVNGASTASAHAGREIPGEEGEDVNSTADDQPPHLLLESAYDVLFDRVAGHKGVEAGEAVAWLSDAAVRITRGLHDTSKLPESLGGDFQPTNPIEAVAVRAVSRLAESGLALEAATVERLSELLRLRFEHKAALKLLRGACEAQGAAAGELWADWASAAMASGEDAAGVLEEALKRSGSAPHSAGLWEALVQLRAASAPLTKSTAGAPRPDESSDTDSDDSSVEPRLRRPQPGALEEVCRRAVAAVGALGFVRYGEERQHAVAQVARSVLVAHPASVECVSALPKVPEETAMLCVDLTEARETEAAQCVAGEPSAKRRRGEPAHSARSLLQRFLRPGGGLEKSAALWARWIQLELSAKDVPKANRIRAQAARSGVSAEEVDRLLNLEQVE
eukprot:Hpha_TRINITY_DN9165_c0_g1::TRINITY_DN9165_c0_g1_i1::g.94665::m.94665/K14557/UTP6; U3 small nucleolar RNA-associated protein 6